MTTHDDTMFKGKGGGPRIAAALFAVLALAAISAVGTYFLLYPRDTLAHLVPARAIAYAHYRMLPGQDARIAETLFRVPDGLRPAEAAAFLLPADEDGADIRWGLLLAWGRSRPVSDDERAVLEGLASRQIDDGTYFIGTATTAISHAYSVGRTYGSALLALRGLAPVQVLFPEGFLEGNIMHNDAVFGMALMFAGDTVRATVISATDLTSALPFIGFRINDGGQGLPRTAGTATVSLSQSIPTYDPMALLLPDVFRAAIRHGTPRSEELASAYENLTALLDRPAELDLIPDATTAAGHGYALRYDGISMDELATRMRRFLTAALPNTRRFDPAGQDLPMHEFVAEADDPFTPTPDGGLQLSVEALTPIFLSPTEGGVIIANSLNVKNKALSAQNSADPACGPATGTAQLIIRSPRAIFADSSPIGPILSSLATDFLAVRSYGDNLVILCGLIRGNVDN